LNQEHFDFSFLFLYGTGASEEQQFHRDKAKIQWNLKRALKMKEKLQTMRGGEKLQKKPLEEDAPVLHQREWRRHRGVERNSYQGLGLCWKCMENL